MLYIQGETARFTVNDNPTATTFTLQGATASWADGAAIILARKSGAGADAYATAYPRPDDSGTVVAWPVSATDNEINFFIRPGEYGVRVSNSSNVTTQLTGPVHLGGSNSHIINPEYDSLTAGIQEAIDELPSAGGVIELGPYTYTLATTGEIVVPSNVTIVGADRYLTVVKRANSSTTTLRVFDITTGGSNITFKNFTVDGNRDNNLTSTVDNIRGDNLSDVNFDDMRIINGATDGVSIQASGGVNTRIWANNLYVSNCGGKGFEVEGARQCRVESAEVLQVSDTGIAFGPRSGSVAATIPDRSFIVHCHVNRSTAPTNFSGSHVGNLVSLGAGAEEMVCDNNILIDNRLTTTQDGIGGGAAATGNLQSARRFIRGNLVMHADGIGINAGPGAIVSGNRVENPGTHGIVAWSLTNLTGTQTMKSTTIQDNVIYWDDAAITFAALGVSCVLDSTTANLTGENMVMRNNTVTDARSTGRILVGIDVQLVTTASGLTNTMASMSIIGNIVTRNDHTAAVSGCRILMDSDDTSVLGRLTIAHNDFEGISSSTAVASIDFPNASEHSGISSLKVKDNHTIASDPYSDVLTLSSGTINATNVNWPIGFAANTLYATVSRVDINGSTGADSQGHLEAEWDGSKFVITARKADTTTATADVSKVYFEFVGTAK